MPDFRIHNLTPIPALDLTVSTEFVANSPTTTSLRAARAGDREHQLLSNEEYRSQGDKRSIIQICHTIQNSQCCKSGEGWSIGVSPDQWNHHVNNYGVNDVSDQCFSDYFSDCFSVHCTVQWSKHTIVILVKQRTSQTHITSKSFHLTKAW